MPKALVAAAVVVIVDVLSDAVAQGSYIVLGVQVDVFTFDGAPEAFYPYVVKTSGPAVHTDVYSVFLTGLVPLFASILHALIRVDYLRASIPGDSPLKHLNSI